MYESAGKRRARRAAEPQAEEAARQPRDGQDEEREAARARAPESGVEREREDRDEVLRRQQQMADSVVHGPEAGRDEMRVGSPGNQESGEERQCSCARPARSHRIAFQRNPNPAIATSVPATRRRARPHGQRWTRPTAMPERCRSPVATTNPML